MTQDAPPMPTKDELTLIGAQMLDMVGTSLTLGHTTPGHSLDYLNLNERKPFWIEVVYDYTAWVSQRKSIRCDFAGDRISTYVRESGWQRKQLDHAASTLTL